MYVCIYIYIYIYRLDIGVALGLGIGIGICDLIYIKPNERSSEQSRAEQSRQSRPTTNYATYELIVCSYGCMNACHVRMRARARAA